MVIAVVPTASVLVVAKKFALHIVKPGFKATARMVKKTPFATVVSVPI